MILVGFQPDSRPSCLSTQTPRPVLCTPATVSQITPTKPQRHHLSIEGIEHFLHQCPGVVHDVPRIYFLLRLRKRQLPLVVGLTPHAGLAVAEAPAAGACLDGVLHSQPGIPRLQAPDAVNRLLTRIPMYSSHKACGAVVVKC